jgi:phage terminase small subunit
MGKKKKRELTPRRARLIKEMLKGKTLAKAGESAGYSPKNPAQSAFQALSQIQKSMPEVMHRLGLTRENLIEKHLKPLLRAASRQVFCAPREGQRLAQGRSAGDTL